MDKHNESATIQIENEFITPDSPHHGGVDHTRPPIMSSGKDRIGFLNSGGGVNKGIDNIEDLIAFDKQQHEVAKSVCKVYIC